MKCPYCNYEDGWGEGIQNHVKGDEGGFYQISNDLHMEREGGDGYHTTKDKNCLYGCPKCNKVFMD